MNRIYDHEFPYSFSSPLARKSLNAILTDLARTQQSRIGEADSGGTYAVQCLNDTGFMRAALGTSHFTKLYSLAYALGANCNEDPGSYFPEPKAEFTAMLIAALVKVIEASEDEAIRLRIRTYMEPQKRTIA